MSVKHPHPLSLALVCLFSPSFWFLVLCFMSYTLTFSVSYPSSPLILSSKFCSFTWCFSSGWPFPREKDSFYSVASLIKTLCEVSTALLIWQAAHKPEHTHTQSKRWLKTGRGGASDEEQNDDVSLAHVIRGDHLVYEKPLLNNDCKVTKDRAVYYWWMDRRLKMMNSQ